MNCDFWRSRLVELARENLSDAEERKCVMAHLRDCPDCSVFLEEQMALTATLTELAAEGVMAPPSHLESVLLSEFDSSGSWRRYPKPAASILALAAALACFAVIQSEHTAARRVQVNPSVPRTGTTVPPPPTSVTGVPTRKPLLKTVHRKAAPIPIDEAAPFIAIPYTVPLDPRERVAIMRVEMPVTALVAVGLASAAPDPGASAQADVVVGEDGRIRAIRLVSNYSSDRRTNQ